MPGHKKYLVLINYGAYEGWKIFKETDDWQEAVKFREDARSCGGNEVIICAYCPLVVLDGRNAGQYL